ISEAAALAVRAGNDLVMTTPDFFEGAQTAVAAGLLDEAEIDAAVRRILALKVELGLFENPRAPDERRQTAVIGSAEHSTLNLDVARRTLVLLANDGVLPLATTAPKTIAVIGPNADDPQSQLGDWAGNSGQVDWMPDGQPRELIETVLDGLRAVAPEQWTITHHRGADIEVLVTDPQGPFFPDGQPRPPISVPAPDDPALIAEAVAAAQAADCAIVVLGDTVALTGEGRSTATLELQGGQVALLDALTATATPVVLVLLNSKPAALPASAMRSAAIIQAFNPGMRGGRAIAELVLGQIEPTGRLPISVARHVGQQPVYYNQLRGQHGSRYADLTQEPLFVFGEGLSYSTVEYSDLSIEQPELGPGDVVRASVRLTNTGSRPATETIQAYVSDLVTSVTWAAKELKAYRQVIVPAGESVIVVIEVPAAHCTLVTADGRRVVEAGAFELLVGANSQDLLGAGFTITC
ncbi:MAG: beta-glucosidase, partial [Actinoplanes sp.]|nr:beta-glucosidase [Actinoplanes sp.]